VLFYTYFLQLKLEGSAPFVDALPFVARPGDSTAALIAGANINAITLLSVVIFVTLLFVIVFRFRLGRVLHTTVILVFSGCWGGFSAYLIHRCLIYTRNPMDIPTLIYIAINLGACGAVLVFGNENVIKAPSGITNFLLIFVAATAAWPMACFSELTVLFFLIWMVIYDLLAVLLPCGPLAYVMKIQQQRVWMAEEDLILPKGMIYHTRLYNLGLGDFAFFGLVVARFCLVDWPTCVAGVESMLAATIFTVLLTTKLEQTIPALPLALIIAFVAYFCSRFSLEGFVLFNAQRLIFV